jgi:excisionase family DNA binding protein
MPTRDRKTVEEMTVSEAARRLGISERAVRKQIENGTRRARRTRRRNGGPGPWIVTLHPDENALENDESSPNEHYGATGDRETTSEPTPNEAELAKLVGDLTRQLKDAAGLIGYLQGQLDALKLLPPPPEPHEQLWRGILGLGPKPPIE